MSTMLDDEVLALGAKRAGELGLNQFMNTSGLRYYNIQDIYLLLGSGHKLFGAHDGEACIHCPWIGNNCESDTHSALLIGIKPLHQPTREERAMELLRELVKLESNRDGVVLLAERALKLLEEGK